MPFFRTVSLAALLGGVWGGPTGNCFGDDLVPPVVAFSSTTIAVSTPPVAPGYVYQGDRFRDPFIPLVGADTGRYEALPSNELLPPFNAIGADLKGILKATTGRWAVLRTVDGVTYLVKNGKVFDPKRKEVEGYQGIVKEKSLVILGPKNEEVILNLKKEAEEK
ncbi:MAG: hypothetical protein JNK54_07165 [Elusimicrobia bacterium]|jgi:hypothetical protein|nr:hypothetical protein [Elusimicrobiota bacterium]